MNTVIIHPISTENQVNIILPKATVFNAEAVLLSHRGERLQRFSLQNEFNLIDLNEYAAGDYVLRIETETEVAVKQIQLGL